MSSIFRSKKEVVYDLLRENILQGKYKPGSRLVIDELAVTLGVSQIPIREAMRQLEADGFVTIEPYVGATVAQLNAEFIFEVFALLEHLEIISSRAACRVMSDEDLQQLAAMIDQMEVVHPESKHVVSQEQGDASVHLPEGQYGAGGKNDGKSARSLGSAAAALPQRRIRQPHSSGSGGS